MSAFVFTAICLVTLRETVPKFPIVPNVGQKDTHGTDVSTGHRRPDIHTQLANPETSRKGRTISHSFQAITISVCSVQEITRPPTVHDNDSHHLLILLLLVQVFPLTNIHLVLHAHLFILIRNHLVTHSESTFHVQTPTLNINTPPFPPNLHQAPLPPHAQNRPNNFYTNPQQTHTPPHPFNTQLPPSFNPHVPPPYFPQYSATTSPSAHSSDSSILLALQKQWEQQRKTRYGAQPDGKRERRKKKDERRERTEKRRQKMNEKM